MAAEPSTKTRAWSIFDRIVAEAAPGGEHSNPWRASADGRPHYEPDFAVLEKLLGVPLHLDANTQSGVPALSLDVWLSYELRRAGFDPDATWPRPTHPRILPGPVAKLLQDLPADLRRQVSDRLTRKAAIPGVTSASANILGKNYLKQVDVIMTDWATGPELLISTKRMDSSYGKNAANRVEESYGDAKNLRLRHPLAALGFVFGLRSDILQSEPDTAEWLIDLLGKLGEEEDAYHATCLVMIEYGDDAFGDSAQPGGDAAGAGPPAAAGEAFIDTPPSAAEESMDASPSSDGEALLDEPPPLPGIDRPGDEDATGSMAEASVSTAMLPRVRVQHESIPQELSPARFLRLMVNRVLDTTPVSMHREARRRRREALAASQPGTSHSARAHPGDLGVARGEAGR
ncbi:hypothetical protein GCM10022261_03310 [Brevibacterium daeguense]|uniref:Restriction endonuclease n=1 Tax=Brevibacterium daeguense TaxID=909936 RepID=A0ABP8EFZ3_9MICO|nr:hypothetical protein [Brevibacterium daeguense]